MKNFGIIGKSLVHSFSPDYFGRKFLRMGITDSQYLPYPLENIEDFEKLCQKNVFAGLNVTIPYKKKNSTLSGCFVTGGKRSRCGKYHIVF